jgi:hypothetical protein
MEERNNKLIRNLLGRQVDEHLVRIIEQAHDQGKEIFPRLTQGLFITAESNIQYATDVVIWVARVLPDNAHEWIGQVMCAYRSHCNARNLHIMMIMLLQCASALESVPSNSSRDLERFDNLFPGWLGELLARGRKVPIQDSLKTVLEKAMGTFVKRAVAQSLIGEATRVMLREKDHTHTKNSLTEFVLRNFGMDMMNRSYDFFEVAFVLATSRQSRGYYFSKLPEEIMNE